VEWRKIVTSSKLEDATDNIEEVPCPACYSCAIFVEIASIACPESLLELRQKELPESRERRAFINPDYVFLVNLSPDHDASKKSAIGYDLIRRRGWRGQ
jgi:hypothetical protein